MRFSKKRKNQNQNHIGVNSHNTIDYFISIGSRLMSRRREILYNDHHRCPRSRFGATNELNVETIKMNVHDAIHLIFSNLIFPEQIEKLTDMTSRVLKPEVYKELIEWLNERDIHDPTQWYKDGALLLPKRFRK